MTFDDEMRRWQRELRRTRFIAVIGLLCATASIVLKVTL